MRTLSAKDSGSSAADIGSGFCGGFAAREEVVAKGFADGPGVENGFAEPKEKGFAEGEPPAGDATPKRLAPMLACCFFSSTAGAGFSAAGFSRLFVILTALIPLILPSFLLHAFLRQLRM